MINYFKKISIVSVIFLFSALFLRGTSVASDNFAPTTTTKNSKTIYIAAFFPGTSTFSHSRLKRRITRKKSRKNKIKKINSINFRQFIIDEKLIIEAASDVNKKNRLLVYWQLGEVITKEAESHSQKNYDTYLIRNLAIETAISEEELNNIVIFYNIYKIASFISLELSWEHYTILVTVKDDSTRNFYQELAVKKAITPEELKSVIDQKIHENHNDK